jgi:hypothetical protein
MMVTALAGTPRAPLKVSMRTVLASAESDNKVMGLEPAGRVSATTTACGEALGKGEGVAVGLCEAPAGSVVPEGVADTERLGVRERDAWLEGEGKGVRELLPVVMGPAEGPADGEASKLPDCA